MSIKSIILEEVGLLLEKRIAQISANITISFDIQETGHSNKQKFRHKNSNGIIILNSEIRDVIEKSKDDISFNIAYGEIVDETNFVVSSTEGKLISLAIVAKKKTPYQWDLIIRTVFSEKAEGIPFMVGRDQLHIVN